MKNQLLVLTLLLGFAVLNAKEKSFGYVSSSGRWIKVARIQNQNPIGASERAQISGTLNMQTDFGQSGSEQYYATYSFGCRGGIKPLLFEIGDAANRSSGDASKVEWRIYKDSDNWHYLWVWQSNYSGYANFSYQSFNCVEYWEIVDPPADYTLVWSSLNGTRQSMSIEKGNFNDIEIKNGLSIGTTELPIDYKLAVDGKIRAREVKVDQETWSDFVFEEEYTLPQLSEVENHIKTKQHLPGVPSEADVRENGIEIGAMNKILLQKIEEITLYMIELEKVNQAQSELIEEQQQKLEILLNQSEK